MAFMSHGSLRYPMTHTTLDCPGSTIVSREAIERAELLLLVSIGVGPDCRRSSRAR